MLVVCIPSNNSGKRGKFGNFVLLKIGIIKVILPQIVQQILIVRQIAEQLTELRLLKY